MNEKRWYVSPEFVTIEAIMSGVIATSSEDTTAPGWGDGGDLFNE